MAQVPAVRAGGGGDSAAPEASGTAFSFI